MTEQAKIEKHKDDMVRAWKQALARLSKGA